MVIAEFDEYLRERMLQNEKLSDHLENLTEEQDRRLDELVQYKGTEFAVSSQILKQFLLSHMCGHLRPRD